MNSRAGRGEAPRTKLQPPRKGQSPSFKWGGSEVVRCFSPHLARPHAEALRYLLTVGGWNLKFHWSLEVGCWSFSEC